MFSNDRVLAVDDNVTNLAVLDELLGDSFMLKCVTSGEEALRIAPSYHPNVVLLDLMMPAPDGNDTCRLLRAKPGLEDTKIVMLSARPICLNASTPIRPAPWITLPSRSTSAKCWPR